MCKSKDVFNDFNVIHRCKQQGNGTGLDKRWEGYAGCVHLHPVAGNKHRVILYGMWRSVALRCVGLHKDLYRFNQSINQSDIYNVARIEIAISKYEVHDNIVSNVSVGEYLNTICTKYQIAKKKY